MAGTMIVKLGMLLSSVLFLFAAVKPTFDGGSLDVTFFVIGIACTLVGLVLLRKPRGPHDPAGA